MTKLYIDIDGVLLTTKQAKPANNVITFIDFMTTNFDCYWLTTHCKGNDKTVLAYLKPYFDTSTIDKLKTIKPTNWETLKTEALDFTSDFFWLDDNPFNAEINVLQSHACVDKLIVVDLRNEGELERIVKKLQTV
jgi:hypothetical protein